MAVINFKKNFDFLRKKYNFTFKEIVNKTGIKKTTLDRYEYGNSLPNYVYLNKIAKLFNVSADFILLNSKNFFINYPFLFELASKTNELPSMPRNHIEEAISQFIKKNIKIDTYFDDENKYCLSDSIHENLKTIREINEISQGDLAKIIGLSSRVSISNIERKKAKVPYESLYIISSKFKISIHYMITGNPLSYKIEDSILFKNLKIFDKLANIDNIKIISALMKKILENNNIPV